jgi:phospholipid/cholesterol/gamma-HCH transport system permease protein
VRSNTAATAGSVSGARLRSERDEAGALRLILSGHLDVDSTGALWREAMLAARGAGRDALVVDASGLAYCDTAGAALLVAIEREQRAAGGSFAIEGLRDEFGQVVAMLRPSETAAAAKPAKPTSFLAGLGRSTLEVVSDLRALIAFVGELAVFVVRALRHPGELRFRDAVTVADRAGIGAVPIVALVGFLLGLILAFQGAIPMQRFGAEIFVADLLGISMLRELGPLMAAILLTARSGSAFAAEIGTMKVNEEIDALSTMGLEPVRFLVVPRVLAAVAVVPALTVLTSAFALIGGLVVFVQLGFPPVTFANRILESVTASDVIGGFAKALVFGVIVAAVGCLRGLQTGNGAQAVGASATSAVVSGIILIAATDGIFAVVFYVLGI